MGIYPGQTTLSGKIKNIKRGHSQFFPVVTNNETLGLLYITSPSIQPSDN